MASTGAEAAPDSEHVRCRCVTLGIAYNCLGPNNTTQSRKMTPSDSPSPLPELATLLQAAVALHQQGHLARAEGLYKKALASYPEPADA